MAFSKWYDGLLKEAGLEATAQNRKEIENVIRQYIVEQASDGRCSTEWEEAGREIQADEQMKQELLKRLRLLYLKWIRYKSF